MERYTQVESSKFSEGACVARSVGVCSGEIFRSATTASDRGKKIPFDSPCEGLSTDMLFAGKRTMAPERRFRTGL